MDDAGWKVIERECSPGLRTSTNGVYFADADLVCSGISYFGRDRDMIYEWRLLPVSGDAYIIGNPVKVGSDRVQVGGTGTFYLHVRVTFHCIFLPDPPGRYRYAESDQRFVDCIRDATVRFTQ